MDSLERSFLADARRLNKKRQEQVEKRVKKAIKALESASGVDETEGIIQSLKMPSSKEWGKLIKKLVVSSAEAGVIRAHKEIDKLRDLYEFKDTWKPSGSYGYEVVFSKEARAFLNRYSYEVGVITEEAVIERIRGSLREGLEEGLGNEELYKLVQAKSESWISDFHAQTIARTENNKMYNAGRLARYQDPEAEGFVEALQYDAITDTRTTDLCENLNGMIVSLSNQGTISKYTPPNHYQCRATWIPVTKYEEWEDNFQAPDSPDDGFQYEAPLPMLLEGKNGPLVKETKK